MATLIKISKTSENNVGLSTLLPSRFWERTAVEDGNGAWNKNLGNRESSERRLQTNIFGRISIFIQINSIPGHQGGLEIWIGTLMDVIAPFVKLDGAHDGLEGLHGNTVSNWGEENYTFQITSFLVKQSTWVSFWIGDVSTLMKVSVQFGVIWWPLEIHEIARISISLEKLLPVSLPQRYKKWPKCSKNIKWFNINLQ